MTLPVIQVKNLNLKYQKKEILKDINLEVYKNNFISILGPSGAGKTSLINCIIGVLSDYSGEIKFQNPKLKKNIGVVFQDSLLYEEISVYKNIYLSLKNAKGWVHEEKMKLIKDYFVQKKLETNILDLKVENLNKELNVVNKANWKNIFLKKADLVFYLIKKLKFKYFDLVWKTRLNKKIDEKIKYLAEKLEISHILKNKANSISGGQKQRVCIAKALVKNSEIIFLDEPFSSLDIDVKNQARDWIKKIQKEFELTIIMVTHDQNDAVIMSDYITFIDDGKVAQFDKTFNFFTAPKTLKIARFIGFPKINFLKKENEIEYYIRPKNIKIKKDENGSGVIQNIINTGNYLIFEIKVKDLVIKAVDVKENFEINQRVSLDYNPKDLIKFDKNGLLIKDEI